MEDLTEDQKLELVERYAEFINALLICLSISVIANVIMAFRQL